MAYETLLEFIKELYLFLTIGNRSHAHLLYRLRGMVFKLFLFYPGVWIKVFEGGYYYIGTHTDDVLFVDTEPTYILRN